MAAQGSGVEHRVQIQVHSDRQGEAAATPEQQLNRFVRCVALVGRAGNALGTLAFTWATVVLLGGYPTVLRAGDYWIATIIVFLEAARMFSRNNRMDYQLFFDTRGAVRPLGWNGLIVVVCYSNVLFTIQMTIGATQEYNILWISMLIAAFRKILSPGTLKLLPKPLRRATSLFSPLVAIILLAPPIAFCYRIRTDESICGSTVATWAEFLVLFLVVLLVTISRLRFPKIIKLVHCALGNKHLLWRRLILNLCMFAALVMLAFMYDSPSLQSRRFAVIAYEAYALMFVSLGNLQIPVAVTRIVLALLRLASGDYLGDDANNSAKTNLAPSLNIFYGMVLGQGVIYIVACMLEIFSFIPRRSLARRGGFRGQWGVESVDLYYPYAFQKYMEGGVLAPKKVSVIIFAMDSLNSDSSKNQLCGVRMLQSLLQKDSTRIRLLSKLMTSRKAIERLISMLDWSSSTDKIIRLFAAKIMVELAKSLRVVTIPGTMQIVSALLNHGNQQKRGNPLLDTDDEQESVHHDPILNTVDNQDESEDVLLDTGNLLETQGLSTQLVDHAEQSSWMLRWWQRVSEFWTTPKEEPLTDQDLLPALGMSILDSLAGCGDGNCEEISRASGLISKIIGFTSYYYRSDMIYTDPQRKVLVKSSLKVLHRLTSIEGEIGVTLRHKISKHPFLLRNLAEILGENTSGQDLRKLVVRILRNLAVDANTRQAIGRIQVIIIRLMHVFLMPDGPSSANADRLLRKVAGQALAMLAMGSVNNCLVMLRETGYVFVKELTGMIHVDKYRCVAAILLRSICLHAQPELEESDLRDLSYALREVLERIMDAEGAELEILIGLTSQICKLIPRDFARELEHGQIEERFMKRLVDALNANMEPSADCPGIRRVILEQAINLMEYDSRYVNCFSGRRLAEALAVVEETISVAENYSLFLGDAGFMEAGEHMPSLVTRAKQLLIAR